MAYYIPFIGAVSGTFPLSIDSSNRFIKTASGQPFLIHGDTAWSAIVNLTNTQIAAYLDDRATKGFTATIVNAIEHEFSNQTPAYQNVDGVNPFTSMTDFASPNNTYWNRLDYYVNYSKDKGMAVVINPAYFGFSLGSQGWSSELTAETAADLQTYGAFLANRYTQGNVIWSLGGDDNGDATLRAKQWNIVTGIRSVRTTDIITAHPSPNTLGSSTWNSGTYPGFNLNYGYCYEKDGFYPFEQMATAYAVSGPIPVIFFEGNYEGEFSVTAAALRRQSYTAILAGACGQFFGNNPIWLFSSGYASSFSSTGATQQQYVKNLFSAYSWEKLQPQTGSTLVTSSKGSTTSPVCPALASDGTFAMTYVPAAQTVTFNTTSLTGVSGNVRIRIYDITAGTYSTVAASEAKNASRGVTTTADCVVVIDQG